MDKKLFEVVKDQTNIKGFWKDASGKVYVDNIIKREYSEELKNKLFASGELAVFSVQGDTALIENSDGSVIVLNTKIERELYVLKPSIVKAFLNKYGGVTIYRLITGIYILEAWQA